MKMKLLSTLLLLLAPCSALRAVTISVSSLTTPVKIAATGALVASGEAKVGWFTGSQPTGALNLPASALASSMFFLGGGGFAGTGKFTITNGQITGSISGFNPSASGDTSYQNKQLFILLLDQSVPVLADAPVGVNYALAMVPKTSSPQWNTGFAAAGNKALGLSTVDRYGMIFGRVENDGAFTATTGFGLVPYVPEPSSAFLLACAGLMGLRRRRG